jgi:cyclophilin family peptidyl-prolyl cis-trans isomerase
MEEQKIDLKKYLVIGFIMVAAFVSTSYIAFKEVYQTRNSSAQKAALYESTNTDMNVQNSQDKPVKKFASAPSMQLEKGKKYSAELHTTRGKIDIELFADKTPVTVNNFVFLAKNNFYENVKFHRVIKGFMIQTGDPLGNGTGGPGYNFNDEKFDGNYVPGTVAMANAGPNTNGSQFFIMQGTVELPKNYVIFGKVADAASMKVVDDIASTPVETNGSGEVSSPKEDILINSIDIKAL